MARAELREKLREKARRIIALYGDDSLDPYALLSDKSYFFTAKGRVVVPYVLSGNLAIVLADPVGPAEERPQRDHRVRALSAGTRTGSRFSTR